MNTSAPGKLQACDQDARKDRDIYAQGRVTSTQHWRTCATQGHNKKHTQTHTHNQGTFNQENRKQRGDTQRSGSKHIVAWFVIHRTQAQDGPPKGEELTHPSVEAEGKQSSSNTTQKKEHTHTHTHKPGSGEKRGGCSTRESQALSTPPTPTTVPRKRSE